MKDLRFPCGEFPVKSLFVPCYFVRLGTLSLCKLLVSVGLQHVGPRQRVKFPVNFPVNRGEKFALDCVLRQSVRCFLSVPIIVAETSIFRDFLTGIANPI
jgi:hypothetical protein